ncbi:MULTISPECIES: hypothetical protein [unclassified Acinetobacter]|uniref:hypothetical protein n=1 Tax=unclassified Acinetobacter TaxID=196816 RepID=UPI0025782D97|nr:MULTISPECIES: hypothetical protein [unclassified Acinetobacter]MDM1755984.1 hypothetical protein [Acinetobacter sp. 256-1]MDM1760574.1 hypothetical protein [Acinetobacter sp. 251-1]
MNEIETIKLKAQLTLGLKTTDDIEQWAMYTLSKDESNQLALDLCFLTNSEQMLHYFHVLPKNYSIDESLKKNIIYNELNKYTTQLILHNQVQQYTWNAAQKIFDLAKYIEDDELYDFVKYYDDEFHLAKDGISSLTPDEIFPLFIIELKKWLDIQQKNSI